MNDYLTFQKFITPMIIQILFWIVLLIIVAGSLIMIAGGADAPYGGGWIILVGLLYLLLGPIFWRMWCEWMLVMFKIHEELHLIRTQGETRP